MSEQVLIQSPVSTAFIQGDAIASVRKEAFRGPSPVLDKLREGQVIAFWGSNNDKPQKIIEDIKAYPLMGGVIQAKIDLLYGGGIRYGRVIVDQLTGMERMIPMRDPVIDKWLRETNVNLYLRKAANDWYTYGNVFVELRMGKYQRYVHGIAVLDASQMRVSLQDTKTRRVDKAYLADWANNATDADATVLPMLDAQFRTAEQVLTGSDTNYAYHITDLVNGQFYYGSPSWDGLRTNGWLAVAKRIPELKRHLLQNLMHIRYHIEFDERYFSHKYKDTWDKKSEVERMQLEQEETRLIREWLAGKGQGGAWGTKMLAETLNNGKGDQMSLVRIHELKLTTAEGAYIEDSQETDFIFCRDMGLDPSLYGISPSKSGSSPGSGSDKRVARTNHVLNCKSHQDRLMEPLYLARDVNGWNEEIQFWMAGYYAASVDRTMSVDRMPNAGIER